MFLIKCGGATPCSEILLLYARIRVCHNDVPGCLWFGMPVAVCEDKGLSQLKQMNDNVLYMFSGHSNSFFHTV